MDGYPAQEAGMKEGDVIKKLNSKKIHLYREVSIYTFFHGDQSIDVVYERDRKTHETKKMIVISSDSMEAANGQKAVRSRPCNTVYTK